MTELQIGLIAIGSLVVGGVLVYNRLQERRARRGAENAFSSGHADVLLEPVAVTPLEPTRPAARTAEHETRAIPDPRLDYIVELAFEDPAGASQLSDQWKSIERRHAHRALLAGSSDGRQWQAALQLVSRDGPVGEAELIEFRSAVETIAASAGAKVDAPEMRAAVETARQLDQFCSDADIQVVMHVTGGPFAGSKIRAAAEAAGLALEDDGRFALRDDGGQLLYALSVREGAPFESATIRDATPISLSLALDVARAPETHRAFESMARLAHQLSTALGGAIVDDNGSALDDRAIGAIAQQLDTVSAQLEERGLAPGSPSALRLFS
jgi:FtsZ-interacting cell division protein ZipA